MITENNSDFRSRLSELDRIFIPEDLDENICFEELTSYRQDVKFWRTVPQKYSLVKQNVFTQEVKNIEGYGIKFIAPLITKTILVSRHTGIKKFTNADAFSSDGIALKVDFNIVMKISDPAKYITEGKNQSKHLEAIINRLLLSYISKFGFEHVVTGECALSAFDSERELEKFSNKYGIDIEKVLIEKVTLPENLRKLYNDRAEELQKKQAQSIRLEAEKEKAKTEAEIVKVQAEAEAEKINILEKAKVKALTEKLAKISISLKKEGLTDEQISQAIRTYIMSETGNVIYLGDNHEAKSIAAGISGSQTVQSKTKKK